MANGRYVLLVVASVAVSVCCQGIPSRCFLEPDRGLCRAFIPSFYYDPLTGACDCFVYGGCLGNDNRFNTLQQCMDGCGVQPRLQRNTAACDRILQEQNPLATMLDVIQGSLPQEQQQQQQPLQPQPQDLQQTLVLGVPPLTQILLPQQPQTLQPQEPQTLQPQLPQSLPPQQPLPQTQQPQQPQPQTQQPQQPQPQTQQPQQPLPQTQQPQQPLPQTQQPLPQTQQPSQQTPATTDKVQVGQHYLVPSLVFTSSGYRPGTLFVGQPVWVPVRRTDDDDDDRSSC